MWRPIRGRHPSNVVSINRTRGRAQPRGILFRAATGLRLKSSGHSVFVLEASTSLCVVVADQAQYEKSVQFDPVLQHYSMLIYVFVEKYFNSEIISFFVKYRLNLSKTQSYKSYEFILVILPLKRYGYTH